MKLSKKKIMLVSVLILIAILAIPFLLEHILFRSHYYSIIDNSDWASFLGSYIGSIFGGSMTLCAVLISINHSNTVLEKEKQIHVMELIEKNKPIFTFVNIEGNIEPEKKNDDDGENITLTYSITLKNVGGMAHNLIGNILSQSDNDISGYLAARSVFIPQNDTVSFMLSIFTGLEYTANKRTIKIILKFSDIKSNYYKQELSFSIKNENIMGIHKVEIPVSIEQNEIIEID